MDDMKPVDYVHVTYDGPPKCPSCGERRLSPTEGQFVCGYSKPKKHYYPQLGWVTSRSPCSGRQISITRQEHQAWENAPLDWKYLLWAIPLFFLWILVVIAVLPFYILSRIIDAGERD